MKTAKKLIIAGGVIELLIALMHFTWPFELIQDIVFAELANNGKDLMLLSSLAVGLCLTVFGSLSIYFALNISEAAKYVKVYSLSQAFLWLFRFIFEIFLPVRFSIYFINNPSNIILAGAFVLILLYVFPVVLIKKDEKN